MSINREFIEINGASVPTVKLVCGTDNFAVTEAQGRSIYFSKELSKLTNESTGLLISELEISSLNLNLKFTVPCVRIEIGSYASTFEEASPVGSELSSVMYLTEWTSRSALTKESMWKASTMPKR